MLPAATLAAENTSEQLAAYPNAALAFILLHDTHVALDKAPPSPPKSLPVPPVAGVVDIVDLLTGHLRRQYILL